MTTTESGRERNLTISVSHLKADTVHQLEEEPETGLLGLTLQEGGICLDSAALSAANEFILADSFLDLYTCLRFATHRGFRLLRFDRNGSVIPGLPLYDRKNGHETETTSYAYSLNGKPVPGLSESSLVSLACQTGSALIRKSFRGAAAFLQRYDLTTRTWSNARRHIDNTPLAAF